MIIDSGATANPLIHIDSPELTFRETGPDYRWISGRRFAAKPLSGDRELLAALVTNDWYDHSFAEPTEDQPSPGAGVHGPYRLDALSAESFVPVDRKVAVGRIEDWVRSYDHVREPFLAKVRALIDSLLPHGDVVYELPDLRAVAEHDWGWVVGLDGFLEFVAISPDHTRLNLLVASDD